jgi:MtfA peptidase
MSLFVCLTQSNKDVVVDFTRVFCDRVEFLFSPSIKPSHEIIWLVAAHAALVGAAQQTNYFESVKWVYLDSELELPDEDGSAQGYTTVRINANKLLYESHSIIPGEHIAIHEFSHILDHYLNVISNSAVFCEEFKINQELLNSGDCYCIDDDNGRKNEFFAYGSELFFTDSINLRLHRPNLYEWFVGVYGLDMANLQPKKICRKIFLRHHNEEILL